MKKFLGTIITISFLSTTIYASNAEIVADYYTGMFSNVNQAQNDPEYKNVAMKTCRVEVENSPYDINTIFLFKTQRVALQAPYLTRLQAFSTVGDNIVTVDNYLIDLSYDPCQIPTTISWSEVGDFRCTMVLTKKGKNWKGTATCAGTLGNAYDKHDCILGDGWFNNWSRGYDENNNLVWGYKGYYHFINVGPEEYNPYILPPVQKCDPVAGTICTDCK
jgi:hypothetical protein